jgi:acrylyl-CoA reductase (NADPH)
MAETFRALVVDRPEGAAEQTVAFRQVGEDFLMEGDVDVEVIRSTVNYKDGLAITGRAPIIRRYPLIPGIDFAGRVISSRNPEFGRGDAVILTGWGVGEKHHGGYAERARVKADWLVPMPETLDFDAAMAIGTAGLTAMLCVLALEEQGVAPEAGEVLVTGASGGVGSVAVALLARRGYHVVASTGKTEEADYLKTLGATEVIDRSLFSGKPRPLASGRWAAAVDVAGSLTLANVLSQMKYGGVVAACGLAQGMDLPASVAPFILRGVRLIGVESVMTPRPRRIAAWKRLAEDLDRDILAAMTRHIALDDVPGAAADIVEGKVKGRLVVDIR